MAFLMRERGHGHAPRPNLILLDLNLLRMDGGEVLARVKDDMRLKAIPTIVLTTSDAEADITASYQLQTNLSEPVMMEPYERLVESISEFWLTQVKLPKRPKR